MPNARLHADLLRTARDVCNCASPENLRALAAAVEALEDAEVADAVADGPHGRSER